MLQSPPHPRSPPLDCLQQLLIFLELGSPELDTHSRCKQRVPVKDASNLSSGLKF